MKTLQKIPTKFSFPYNAPMKVISGVFFSLLCLSCFARQFFVVHTSESTPKFLANYPAVKIVKHYPHFKMTLVESNTLERNLTMKEALFIEEHRVRRVFSKKINTLSFSSPEKNTPNMADMPNTENQILLNLNRNAKEHSFWSLEYIEAKQASRKAQEGQGVNVLVLDHGIDQSHPSLSHRIIEMKDFTNSKVSIGIPYPEYDLTGHGTHVAGIIAADNQLMTGIAPQSNLYIGKVCVYDCESFEKIVDAFEWAIEKNIHVINMSLRYKVFPDQVAAHILKEMEQRDILIVAGAGNEGLNPDPTLKFPAKYPTVLSVGAIDSHGLIADISSFGEELLVVAPGVDILSASLTSGLRSNPDLLMYRTGTSMATPHVVGIAALVKAANPKLSVKEIKKIIIDTTEHPNGVNSRDNKYGYGIVNALRAVNKALEKI